MLVDVDPLDRDQVSHFSLDAHNRTIDAVDLAGDVEIATKEVRAKIQVATDLLV